MLITNILTVSTPAAPATLLGTAGEISQDIRFGFLSRRWAIDFSSFFGLFLRAENTNQTERISRIKVFPGSITVKKGELVVLSAAAYDSQDEPLSGVEYKWTMTDNATRFPPRKVYGGYFKANITGTFTVTAKSRGREAAVTVTVVPSAIRPTGEQNRTEDDKADSISSRSIKSSEQIKSETVIQKTKNEHTVGEAVTDSPNLLPGDGWGDGNWESSDDPGNQPGNPPGSPADDGAGSGNFQLSAPIVSLPGRGIDLALNLNYNSRLWNKSGSQLTYDIDRGFPAPGWSLGFGKIVFMGAQGGCMLVDADGTRHGYSGLPPSNTSSASWFDGHTTDGSLIDYGCTVYYGQSSYAWAKLPNGTQINYSAYGPANDIMYPTLITDANGNYITITYRNGQSAQIETITDTMGRVINFNYDSNNLLLNVTAPRSAAVGQPGPQPRSRTLVQFHYRQLTLGYSLASGVNPVIPASPPWVLDAVYYPATQTGYWFGDADSYSSYGMLTKVVEQRGMNWQASAEEQGLVTAGQMTKQAVYNYPLTTANETGRTNGANLSDAPTYDKLTETWAGVDVAQPAVTTYNIQQNASPRVTTVTQPNGAVSRQYSYNYSSLADTDPNKYKDGLVYRDETYVPDANGVTVPNLTGTYKLVGKSTVEWQEGHYSAPRPLYTEVFDENNQKIRTEFDYTVYFNQVTRSCDYDNNYVKLRCSANQYENNSAYTGQFNTAGRFVGGRHVFNLVEATGVENPDGTKASWMEYEYDNYQNQPFTAAPDVIQHDPTYDQFTTAMQNGACLNEIPYECGAPPQDPITCYYCQEYEQISAYDPGTEARGNVTKVTSYTDANNLTGAISETRGYDVTGNLVKASTSCCQQTSFLYTSNYQYAYPESQTRGSADINSPDRVTTSSTYAYETGLVTQTIDANGRISSTKYNSDTLRPGKTTSSTGAYATYLYDDVLMTVTEQTYESGGAAAGKSVKYLNGVGQTVREESIGANNVSDFVETKYNNLGQIWKQSRPYRAGDALQWSETIYDKQGRTIKVIEPDGSFSQAFYNETARPDSASALAGNTMRVADAWGRELWGRYDQQGRLAEVVEPNPDRSVNSSGSVLSPNSLVTKYQYDTLGRLVQTEQGVQLRKFKYDSLGRLTRQKLAEQTATLTDAGAFVGANQTGAQWSEAFVYDTRSNLTQKTDARGVRTNYAYNNLTTGAEDALNRLQAVIYDTSGPTEANLMIHAAVNITYEYMTMGDKSRIKKIETANLFKEEYAYDDDSRVKDYTQTIVNRENFPFVTSYLYDTLSRVTEVRYPVQYGLGGSSPRRIIEHSYDTASRLTSLKVNGTEQAGNIVYNAADQTTSIKIGAAGANQVTENYTFDPQTGLLTNQKAQKGATTLLDLSYEYDRKNSVGTGNGKTGHLSKIVNNLDVNKNREYEYDALGRLTKAKGGNNLWTENYNYDRYGNRETVAASGVAADGSAIPRDGIANLSYNQTSNRINTAGFEYDSAGNQTRALSEDGQTYLRYEYDSANRLKLVKRDDGTPLQVFTYGTSNARIAGYDYLANAATLYATSGGTTLSEYTEAVPNTPVWTKSYTYLGDSLLSTATPNGVGETTEYSHPDRLGTRTITNQQLGTSYEQTTLPFGTALNAESTASTNKRFTSYDRSTATGLDYAMNRTYDSKQGRFNQVDPIGMSASSLGAPQTLNLYSYCGNDPINHTDPNGLFFGKLFKWFSKAFKWIAIAVTVAVMVLSIFVVPGSQGLLANILGILLKINNFIGVARFSTEGAISVGFGAYISAGFYGVGAIASKFNQTDKPVPLSGANRTIWDASRNTLIGLLNDKKSPCYNFLKDKLGNKAVKKIAKDLKTQTPYDWHLSTNPVKHIGAVSNPQQLSDIYLEQTGSRPDGAVTDGYGGNIYYGGKAGVQVSTVLHENIHKNVRNIANDQVLAEKLGTVKKGENVFDKPEGSKAISKTLEDAGCK